MKGFFDIENPIWKFFEKMFDIMFLSIIWIIFSIPIFTIGASTTALNYSIRKLINEDGYLFSNFFHSFKENFKQATKIWILFLIIGIIIVLDFRWYIFNYQKTGTLPYYILGIATFLYIISITYIFPLLSHFDNTTKNLIKLSIFIPIKHIFSTLFILFTTFSMFIIALFVPILGLFFSGFICYINYLTFNRIFKLYIVE